jgi:hypothetical protein
MSAISVLPETIMALLQGQSIKREIAEKMEESVGPVATTTEKTEEE